MKRYLSILFSCMMLSTAAIMTSCEGEIEKAQALSGVWEGGDLGISHQFRGETIIPYKTVFVFERDRDDDWFGSGYFIEYFHHDLIKEVYYTIRWSTFTGNLETEITLRADNRAEGNFIIPNSIINDQEIKGEAKFNGNTISNFALKRITTKPDVSNVKYWGYNELYITWHTVSYTGQLNLEREYNGKNYTPSKITITFDVDPVYNNGGGSSYIREDYTDAPWGTFLADKVKSWSYRDDTMWLTTEDDTYYCFYNATVTEDKISGIYYVRTNESVDFTLHRTDDPDWDTITQWGIESRLK